MLGSRDGHAEVQRGVGPPAPDGVARADTYLASRPGPRRRRALARIDVAVDLADDFGRLCQRPRQREAVGQHVVLPIAPCRIAQDPQPDVADEANRPHGLGSEHGRKEVGRIETEPAFVRRTGKSGGKAEPERRSPGPFGEEPHLHPDRPVLDARGRVAGGRHHVGQGRVVPLGDRQPVVQPAVDLHFGDGAHADACAEERHAQQIALETRRRIADIAPVIEAGLRENATGADGLGIFGDERTLLGERREWKQQERCRNQEPSGHQNCRLLSTSIVTGPSFTSSTCIMAWNSPVDTGTCAACNSLTSAS